MDIQILVNPNVNVVSFYSDGVALSDESITIIVVEQKDRATRFGFNYIETLLETQERKIEVINLSDNRKEGLQEDLVSIIYSFCSRLYGQRRAKRKTERITKELEDAAS